MASLWPRIAFLSISLWTFVAAGITGIIHELGFTAWRFTDLTPKLTLALDHIARLFAAVRDTAAAFKSFISSALTHPSYTAGHFDPGRMPA